MTERTLNRIIETVGLADLPGFTFKPYVNEPQCGVYIYRDGWEGIYDLPVDTSDGSGLYYFLKHFTRRWKNV